MHGKRKILRFVCLVFKIIGSCNDICECQGFSEGILPVSFTGL
jgi:hypothetical protein